jgi:hypothetical protein
MSYYQLGAFGVAGSGDCATVESLIMALVTKWKALKTKLQTWWPTPQDRWGKETDAEKAKIAKMQDVGKDMDTWRINYLTYAETMKPSLASKLWIGGALGLSFLTPSQCTAALVQLRNYEKQLIALNGRYETISGLQGVPGLDKPSVDVKGDVEQIQDTAWGFLKIGAVGLGIWLLYQYIEKQTRYPESRLPRYAGGRRRSGRRK